MFCVLAVVAALTVSFVDATINITAQTFIIDTSLKPSEYLHDICEVQKENMLRAFPVMLDMIPKAMQPQAEKLATEFWESGAVIEPYHSEIEYLSECSGLPISDVMTVNIIYDLTAFCTSIVAVQTDGTIIHARNQDFPTILRNDTVNMLYVDGDGNTLYESTTFFGYVGIPTGIRFGAFSISIDARYDIYGLKNWLEIKREYFPAGWLVRECLIKDSTFDACIERLSTTLIQAPIYYIVAGMSGQMEGAIVTRNQTQVNGPDGGSEPLYLSKSNHGWYLLETNFDYWRNALDNRRKHANEMLQSVGQENISLETLFNILSTPPVLATDTVYTALMSPSNLTYYDAQIRFDTRGKSTTHEEH